MDKKGERANGWAGVRPSRELNVHLIEPTELPPPKYTPRVWARGHGKSPEILPVLESARHLLGLNVSIPGSKILKE